MQPPSILHYLQLHTCMNCEDILNLFYKFDVKESQHPFIVQVRLYCLGDSTVIIHNQTPLQCSECIGSVTQEWCHLAILELN